MDWNKEKSDNLYGISRWGEGHFGINDRGELSMYPEFGNPHCEISLKEVINEMIDQRVQFPAVIRFHDILRSRVKQLNRAFRDAIREADFQGKYYGVYPIKVNQMREVVEEIVEAGEDYCFGLEAGSKPELLAVLSMDQNPNSLTILNGYKDEEYIRLALLGTQMGRNTVIVVEKPSEVDLIVRVSQELNIKPLIGIRSRLGMKSAGKWEGSSGERAKFGLGTADILHAVEKLRSAGFLDCLKLFHFHIGSQIPEINSIHEAMTEATRFFVELIKLGAPISYLDVGGGLGVDYDGTRSASDSSTNYGPEEYAQSIIQTVIQICDREEVPHPNIVSESGRAITAHHSCVVTKVIGQIRPSSGEYQFDGEEGADEYSFVKNIQSAVENIKKENIISTYNQLTKIKKDSLNAFNLGVISLRDRAEIETYFYQGLNKILLLAKEMGGLQELIKKLEYTLSSQYLCNFSVFQSAADSWAIGQILPVVPITRLNERPTINTSLVDITCDSDGKIGQFIKDGTHSPMIQFHELKEDEDYFLGIFMTGAYQDVMGDMHNMFGRLNEVHVYSDDDDPADFYIEEIIRGQRASHVLKTMQYNPELMALQVKKKIDRLVAKGQIAPRWGVKLNDFYENTLYGYTYLK